MPVDAAVKFQVSGISGPPLATKGQTRYPLPLPVVDVNGDTVPFATMGQATDLSESDKYAKNLVDVVNNMVGEMGYDVVFRKNERGGIGHFMFKRDDGRVLPLPMNAARLPVLNTVGLKPAYPSKPDSLRAFAKVVLAAAELADAGVKKKASAASKALAFALQEASDASDTDSLDSTSDSGGLTDAESAYRKVALRAQKRKERKARRRVARNLLSATDAHNLLHRSHVATHKALAQPEVNFVTSEGKVVSGDRVSVDELKVDCDVCRYTKMEAPARRVHSTCAHE